MLIWLSVVGLSSIACASGDAPSSVTAPVTAPAPAPVHEPVAAPEPVKAGKRRGGGSEKPCNEGERSCRNDDVYSCIEGTLQLAEDCDEHFECTTTVPGANGQAMCDPGGL